MFVPCVPQVETQQLSPFLLFLPPLSSTPSFSVSPRLPTTLTMRSVFMAILVAAAASGASAINCVSSGKVRGGLDEKKKKKEKRQPGKREPHLYPLTLSAFHSSLSLSLSFLSQEVIRSGMCDNFVDWFSENVRIERGGRKSKREKAKRLFSSPTPSAVLCFSQKNARALSPPPLTHRKTRSGRIRRTSRSRATSRSPPSPPPNAASRCGRSLTRAARATRTSCTWSAGPASPRRRWACCPGRCPSRPAIPPPTGRPSRTGAKNEKMGW